MTAVYVPKTLGDSPVTLAVAKAFLRIDSSAEDDIIKALIATATTWGEKYTGREFRANVWTLLLDAFTTRINLARDVVDTVDSVKYLVDDAQVTVATTVYYLKRGVQCSEILLVDGQSWPTDIDEREQAIEIEFTTTAYPYPDIINDGLLRHIAWLYENRGDCDATEAAKNSGADLIYNQFRVSRV